MANLASALRQDLQALKFNQVEVVSCGNDRLMKFSHRNGESEKPTELNNYYWIRGEALVRSNQWPYTRGQRIELNSDRVRPEDHNTPYFITESGDIEMDCDVWIPLSWVTGKAEFYGPVIYSPPWL